MNLDERHHLEYGVVLGQQHTFCFSVTKTFCLSSGSYCVEKV